MTTFEKEYGQDFKITVSQDDQEIKIAHGQNAAIIRHVKTLNMWDVSTWIDSAKKWVESPDLPTIFEAFDLAKKALLACADETQAPAQPLSDQLETIRQEALCAIERAIENWATIELLTEDIFDEGSCWIKQISKTDHPAFKNSTSKLRDQLQVEVFSGDADENMLSYTSDLLTLRTDTLVQIADFLAKN